MLQTCFDLGIHTVTIYAFSIENFKRPKAEVDALLGMLREKLRLLAEREDSFAQQQLVQVRIVGKRGLIPADILGDLEHIEQVTRFSEPAHVLNVCFPYTLQDDMAHAIATSVAGGAPPSVLLLTEGMYFGPQPQLDLLVRTSGHRRLSDFMLWQCTSNCRVCFVDTLWPDFGFLLLFCVLLSWAFDRFSEPALRPAPALVSVNGE